MILRTINRIGFARSVIVSLVTVNAAANLSLRLAFGPVDGALLVALGALSLLGPVQLFIAAHERLPAGSDARSVAVRTLATVLVGRVDADGTWRRQPTWPASNATDASNASNASDTADATDATDA